MDEPISPTVKQQKEHRWLERLVGEWTFENEAVMEPGAPPVKFSGKETARSLGGVWVICEGEGEMPGGGTGRTIMTLGYDPEKKIYLGTFIGSMMTHMWLYHGTMDESGNRLVLDTEGPSFTDSGKMAKYQDIIEFKSNQHRTLSSQFQGDDGKWHGFMTANYRRA